MHTFSRKFVILATLLVFLGVAVWTTRVFVKNNDYKLLGNAVAQQSFADSLPKAERTHTECYSMEGHDYCLALNYVISAKQCGRIAKAFGKDNCNAFNSASQEYRGRQIEYRVARWDDRTELRVYINEVNHWY